MTNQEMIRYFYETVVTKHLIEQVDRFVSTDCTVKIGELTIPMGAEGMRQHLIDVRKTYPEYTMKIVRQFTDGDYVISEFIMEGVHEGEWLGMKPSHKLITMTGVDIDKVIDGKIVEHGGAANTFEALWDAHLIQPVE